MRFNKLKIQEMAKLLENKTQENEDLKNAEAHNKLEIQQMAKLLENNKLTQQFNEMTQKLQIKN